VKEHLLECAFEPVKTVVRGYLLELAAMRRAFVGNDADIIALRSCLSSLSIYISIYIYIYIYTWLSVKCDMAYYLDLCGMARYLDQLGHTYITYM